MFPLSIGLIASYLNQHRPGQTEIKLFKYPHDLSEALMLSAPKIVAFANYSWNFSISRAYAENIKKMWPDTIIVFGGPNYGLTDQETETFWGRFGSFIDFYVAKEGEEAFVQLYDVLHELDFDAERLKVERRIIGNVHYSVGGQVIIGPTSCHSDEENGGTVKILFLLARYATPSCQIRKNYVVSTVPEF